jgi:hypothetical protein
MTTPFLASRTLRVAAKRRHASSSVAPVASGYARSREPQSGERHSLACFSPSQSATYSEGDR